MSKARIKGDPDESSCYHVMSRTVADTEGGMMFFGAHEKNVFAKQLRKQAEFAGIEIMTWCMMDNHFHILIRVPARKDLLDRLMADGRDLFWRKLRVLYSRNRVKALKEEVEKLEADGAKTTTGQRVMQFLNRFTRRMGDLSEFMRGLKRVFSVWFNRKYGRKGTVWMERFKGVLLEGENSILLKVAAYIDLNPVRAGLVKDPGDYRWSGYGQAIGGRGDARRGLSAVYGHSRNEWRRISQPYREFLYLEGMQARTSKRSRLRAGAGASRNPALAGRFGTRKRLSGRVRYFTYGAAIGSREFLEAVFEKNRSMFGSRRKTGARRFRGAVWKGQEIFSLRDLGPG